MGTGAAAKSQVTALQPPSAGLTKPAPIRLRLDLFDRVAVGRGWRTDSEKARMISVDPSVFGRVRRGEVAPGVRFIAGVLSALPEWPFHELFVVDMASDAEVTE